MGKSNKFDLNFTQKFQTKNETNQSIKLLFRITFKRLNFYIMILLSIIVIVIGYQIHKAIDCWILRKTIKKW